MNIFKILVLLSVIFSFKAATMFVPQSVIDEANSNLEDKVFEGWHFYLLHDAALSDDFNEIKSYLLYRQIFDDQLGDNYTFSPVGLSLLLHGKQARMENTFITFIKFPASSPEPASINIFGNFLTNRGGSFTKLKNFMKPMIGEHQSFNLLTYLPDGHVTLLVYRPSDVQNKFFIIDSVGKVMRFQAALRNTINEAFSDLDLADRTAVLFGNYPRQADSFSCAIIASKDLFTITKYPQILDKICLSVNNGNLVSIAGANKDVWNNIFTNPPAHFFKCAQVYNCYLDTDYHNELFEGDQGMTLGQFLHDKEISTSQRIEHPKVGGMWQNLDLIYARTEKDFGVVEEIMKSLDEDSFFEIFRRYFKDLDRQ